MVNSLQKKCESLIMTYKLCDEMTKKYDYCPKHVWTVVKIIQL